MATDFDDYLAAQDKAEADFLADFAKLEKLAETEPNISVDEAVSRLMSGEL